MTTESSNAPLGANKPARGSQELVRSLRRITEVEDWPVLERPIEPLMTIAVVDTETDGLDGRCDTVLEIAAALIQVEAEGRIVRVVDHGFAQQEPDRPIPPRISRLTGLSAKSLAGKTIPMGTVSRFINRADAILAHHAGFDRNFCERLLPDIDHLPWICSMRDVDWLGHGYDGAKLGHLLMQNGLFAPAAHNAADDVEALVNLLACRLPNDRTVIGEAIATARVPTVRIDAAGAPYIIKDELKRFGYRWNPRDKTWWTEVRREQVDAEIAWLAEQSPMIEPKLTEIDWHNRFR